MSLEQSFVGRIRYLTDHADEYHSLLVVVPCRLEGQSEFVYPLLDSASEWCILKPDLARSLGLDPDSGGQPIALHTRFGTIQGRLERYPLRFPAMDGAELAIEATWFISPHWPGPNVLGWRGGLERLRYCVDPRGDWFYFSDLNQP